MASTDRREALKAAVLKALPIDPGDGTTVIGVYGDGTPLWSKPEVLADTIGQPLRPRVTWSSCATQELARQDLDLAKHEGWPDPCIEHRRVGATEWERVTV